MEASELAEVLLDAETRLGALLAELPKAQGRRTDKEPARTATTRLKADAVQSLGFNKDSASRLEALARHPDKVEEAKAAAREEGRIVTREDVLQSIKQPHVSHNSGDNEWYTPSTYIAAARKVMGDIDLDPASSEAANEVVLAAKYYTQENDGLTQTWEGRIWLNPPYASNLIGLFIDKLQISVADKDVDEAIVLVNNATDTKWFSILSDMATMICFPRGRIKFWKPGHDSAAPLQGQCLAYIGSNKSAFVSAFAPFGLVVEVVK
jgi:ParB family chromosome partitioning protein